MTRERGGDYNDKAEGWKMIVGVEVTKKRSGGIGDALGHCRGGFNKGQGSYLQLTPSREM